MQNIKGKSGAIYPIIYSQLTMATYNLEVRTQFKKGNGIKFITNTT